MFTIELGSKVKTRVRGFAGMVTSRSENLYGCNRYFIEPPIGKENKVPDGYWFDEDDVVLVSAPKAAPKRKNTGGPMGRTR